MQVGFTPEEWKTTLSLDDHNDLSERAIIDAIEVKHLCKCSLLIPVRFYHNLEEDAYLIVQERWRSANAIATILKDSMVRSLQSETKQNLSDARILFDDNFDIKIMNLRYEETYENELKEMNVPCSDVMLEQNLFETEKHYPPYTAIVLTCAY